MSFGKSKARLVVNNEKNKVTFEDVAGVDEEKEELEEIVEFLKTSKKIYRHGSKNSKRCFISRTPRNR